MCSVIDCSDLGLFLPESRDTIQGYLMGQMAPWHPFYNRLFRPGSFLPESRDTIQGQMAPWHPFYTGVNKIDKVTRFL